MRIGAQDVIWITGAKGRIGRAIQKELDHGRYAVITTGTELDVGDYSAVSQFVAVNRPNIIINCAGMTNMQECADNPVEAFRVNALGARNLAAAAEGISAKIVQMSSDDVFSGVRNVMYDEFDKPHPKHIYGKSKLAGETFVRELNPRHIIVRSCWIYADMPNHFFGKLLATAKAGGQMEVPANQFSSPTSSLSLARCIIALIDADEFGTFHAADAGICSRADFALQILRQAGLPEQTVVPTYDPDNAYRLTLNNMMLQMTKAYEMPNWQDDLTEYMSTLASQDQS